LYTAKWYNNNAFVWFVEYTRNYMHREVKSSANI